ncbi:hypothetical protein A2U01_0109301, partial [Trifolium medium]|nr:hypothetical protein [Trifolium medium]
THLRAAQTTCARHANSRNKISKHRATCQGPKLNRPPALNGASRQMHLRAVPEAEHEEIVAV